MCAAHEAKSCEVAANASIRTRIPPVALARSSKDLNEQHTVPISCQLRPLRGPSCKNGGASRCALFSTLSFNPVYKNGTVQDDAFPTSTSA
jgi:hypothetical protein